MRVLLHSNMFPGPGDPQLGLFVRDQVQVLERRFGIQFEKVVSQEVGSRPIDKAKKYAELYLRGGRWSFSSFDLIHMHYPSLLHGPAALGPWLLGRLPLVVTLHGDELKLPSLESRRGRLLGRALSRVDRVIAVSEENAKLAQEAGVPLERISVIHMGVDLSLFSAALGEAAKRPQKEALGLDPARPAVLFAGRLVPDKGLLRLVRALLAIDAQVSLVIAGDGPEAAQVKQLLAGTALFGRTRWLGFLAHAELPPWFRAADLLVLPSQREGMPLVVLEAMASGTPVLASRVGGIAERIRQEHNGMLFGVEDAGALAAGLRRLLSNRLLADRLARTALFDIGEHSLEHQAERVHQVYQSMLRGR